MLIYNTLTRKKEELIPITAGKVKIYACGPTVYNLIHLGNARQICVFDVMRRYLKYKGYEVLYVQNFTDVDDRIIKLANEKGITPLEYSESMIREYFTDARGLNILDADIHPKVTESIDLIIDIIKILIEKEYAYESGGDVYFAVEKFPNYGRLSGNTLEELKEGASNRLDDESEKKRSPVDFALWKGAKPNEPFWEADFGKGIILKGRPGWHIECSAMSRHYIGDTIDIHGGGSDLIFPHHENEIMQSEAATGQPLAKYWAHNGMLNIDSRKMSKSAKNFFLVREAAVKHGYEPLRFMLLNAHYRSQMNYTEEVLESAVNSVERLKSCKLLMERELNNKSASDANSCETSPETKEAVLKRREQFISAMDDDFNTADAISAMFELVRDINSAVNAGISATDLSEYKRLFDEINGVLGLLYVKEKAIPAEITALIEKRALAKKEKDYALADKLREEIGALGYVIEETRTGVNVKKKG